MQALKFLTVAVLFFILSAFHSAQYRRSTGMSLPEMSLRDTSGHSISLKDFKGKFVYLEFWASWCRPCMREMQPLHELQEQMAGNDNIVWVLISYDKDKSAWRSAIAEKGVKGIHLIASSKDIQKFKDELNIYSIPFSIWVGKDGKIVKYDAPRPSEGIYHKLSKAIAKAED